LRLHRGVERLHTLTELAFVGLGLGALTERRRYAIDRAYYDRERMYHTAQYNEQGLWPWEQKVMDLYFTGCSSIVVASAGGGREVIALCRRGVVVTGFECHSQLAQSANVLLRRHTLDAVVHESARDECAALGGPFASALIGWSGYTLIRGRARRIRFLRGVRALVPRGAPVLLSFMTRGVARRFEVAARIANASRHLLGGEPSEAGDYLVPNFVHFFTRDEIECEVSEGGFQLAFYSATPYGHAVAHAV
jgi:hypothetical protein